MILSYFKPCPVPWCSGETGDDDKVSLIHHHRRMGLPDHFKVRCNACGIETPIFESDEEATRAWNSRRAKSAKPLSNDRVQAAALAIGLMDDDRSLPEGTNAHEFYRMLAINALAAADQTPLTEVEHSFVEDARLALEYLTRLGTSSTIDPKDIQQIVERLAPAIDLLKRHIAETQDR